MKKNYLRYLFYATAAVALCSHAFGQIIIQHSGATDPLTEGFVLADAPERAAVGPVFDDLGFDAWSINPRSGNEGGIYYYQLTPLEQQAAMSQGWVLSANIRLLDHDTPGGHQFRFVTGAGIFAVRLFAESNGDITVSGRGTQIEPFTLEGGAGAYHEYALVYNAASERAALWIDGLERVADIFDGSADQVPRVSFGSAQTISHAHWNDVTLTIIPEPATMAFLAGVGALLLVVGVRWRQRKGRLN